MKILDVDYFVKGHHTAQTYAAAHEICRMIILDSQKEEFRDPDQANTYIMVEFAVYVNELTYGPEIEQAMQQNISQALLQDFQFCVSTVDPEIKYFEDRRQKQSK